MFADDKICFTACMYVVANIKKIIRKRKTGENSTQNSRPFPINLNLKTSILKSEASIMLSPAPETCCCNPANRVS